MSYQFRWLLLYMHLLQSEDKKKVENSPLACFYASDNMGGYEITSKIRSDFNRILGIIMMIQIIVIVTIIMIRTWKNEQTMKHIDKKIKIKMRCKI